MPFPSFSVQCKVFLGVVVSLLAGGPAPPAGAASSQRAAIGFQTPQVASLEALRTASATPVRVRFDEGFPVTLSFDVEATGATGVERATNFLSQYAPLFRQDHPDVQLLPLRDSGDPAGMELVRFYQTFQGLPVFGAELAVHVLNSATGGPAHIFFASGALLSPVDAYRVTITLDTVPAITADAAADVARTELSRPGAPVLGESPLMIYDPTLFGMAPGPRLVWRVTLGGGDPVQILVDANSSQAVFQRPLTATGTGLADFDLDLEDANGGNMGDTNCFNPTTIDDQIGDEDGYDSTYSTDLDAVMEWGAARTTYLTYHNRYGRHSFDDDDGELYVYVHGILHQEPNADAVAGCDGIEFSEGWGSFDVTGHEFTHLVIANTSDLHYVNQSGALNESLADIQGSMVDAADWLLAEDRTGGFGAIRSMADPTNGPCGPPGNTHPCNQPDRMSSPQYPPAVSYPNESNDYGGVHTKSGVINKAFYLMAQGGTFNGVAVSPMGRDKMGALAYVLLTGLPHTASFYQAREYAVSATSVPGLQPFWQMIFGFLFTAQDTCTVRNAFAAVEIGVTDVDCNGVEDDVDTDGDGFWDVYDNCPLIANPIQFDSDHDGIGDLCDDDLDGDGWPNGVDLCPNTYNPGPGDILDADQDGVGDACDLDDDGDGILDDGDLSGDPNDNPCGGGVTTNCDDNCIHDPNPNQYDGNSNGQGDACDPDTDGDGVYDSDWDNCPFVANTNQLDTDSDGLGDACDLCPTVSDNLQAYTPAICVSTPGGDICTEPVPLQPDSDGDGIPDACDHFGFGPASFTVNGAPYSKVAPVSPDGLSKTMVLTAPAGAVNTVRAPFPACDTVNPDGPGPQERVELVFTGIDASLLEIWLEDGSGQIVGRAREPRADPTARNRGFRFKPRCSEDYYLYLRTTTAFPGTVTFPLTADVTVPVGDNPWESTPAIFVDPAPPLPDADADGLIDSIDTCPATYDPTNHDLDGDGTGDVCDPDADGDGYSPPSDCDDLNAATHPGAVEVCDGADNNCDRLTDEDTDGDGFAACSDCDNANRAVWAVPGWVLDLQIAGDGQTLGWLPPAEPGGTSLVYDTLRSTSSTDFVGLATCVESDDGTDTTSVDATVPSVGSVLYYEVDAENVCGVGSLGTDSSGVARVGRACP